MAVQSRYASPSQTASGAGVGYGLDSATGGTTNGSESTSSTSSQTQQKNEVLNENTSSNTVNMAPAAQAALQQLIQQLLGGGTAEMKEQKAARGQEVTAVRNQRQAYSKEAAFGDAQGLVSQQMRRVLEQLLPSINRSAESAGSSGGALRALLLQDAATKAAESSSALGVQTATAYGGIASNLSQILERLTASDPTVTNALTAALNVAKGAVQTTTGSRTAQSTGTTNTTGTESKVRTASEQKSGYTDYTPFGVTQMGPPSSAAGGQLVYGQLNSEEQLRQNVAELLNGGSGWDSYKF